MTSTTSTSPLRDRRIRAGLSLRDVSTFANINRGKVSLFERGRYIPTPDELGRYMEVLGDHESYIGKKGQASFLTPEERTLRTKARNAVTTAIRKGLLRRGPCETCGAPQATAHHRNGYANPLDVVWLCGMHHGMEHHEMNWDRMQAANEARRREAGDKALAVRAKYREVLL